MLNQELREACENGVKQVETILATVANDELPIERLRNEKDICDFRIGFDAQTGRFESVSMLLSNGGLLIWFYGEPKSRNECFHEGELYAAENPKDARFAPRLTTHIAKDVKNAYRVEPGHEFCAKINEYAEKVWNSLS